jgi:hypothetical protein
MRCDDCVYCVGAKTVGRDEPEYFDTEARKEDDGWYDWRECRRNPPQFYTTQESGRSIIEHKRGWPYVRKDEWCGEFRCLDHDSY